ncbi:heterogeneous nuclear ribonucleoprotein 1-like [Punica granatum]|uniref:RRM domain-containing protein n=2 Tax=Punica granatum TaxID=22663 RepID=A0A218WCB8_PUNGR|nr:heterogeneous nuclear ribonucleoprotein 1-like [Punica granatum]OWM70507.1 hypothetical protein CDL15_Pgr011983 [Punica granatum]PKI78592.1 hypothetical protein CRG98_000969 [Punica granatum]
MDSDQGKLFIGGISWETNEDKLTDYFSQYGDVLQTAVMKDKTTGRPRGFGFVVFSDPDVLDKVLEDKHTIDGRTVEAKRALSREEQQTNVRSGVANAGRSAGVGGTIRTKKIFVGGLPSTLTEEEFRQYFETYGTVTDVVVMYDQNTQRPRGFGFISFESEDAVDRVLHKTFHDLSGKKVEVKRALPKDANPGGGNRTMISGGGYQGYGSSVGNGSSIDGRMDSSRYMQPHGSAGGFPPYGSSGYGTPGYGYGPTNGGIGYTGYGSYGSPSARAYGNPNVPTPGFGVGPQGGARAPWSSQSSGFGAMGYGGAAPWGATSAGSGAVGGGPVSTPSVQSPGGVVGYGSQAYGYGGYAGAEAGYGIGGRYGSSPGNGVRGPGVGEMQGSNMGYMGGGYGDVNGSAAWRSDLLHVSGNYGNNPNAPHGTYRQAQQQ